ncbi:hypothetical protein [Parabacteroides sp. PF5-9]|uniref:hypothetical protein n=1 Tax=Parabacteroides sp. PF5-9 TaxID=1742404 RepID=UPI002476897F|nr:hypothetical protein [Parabacteroides sp. PF5-9]MDH6358134.1 hypothetical protein [Parabacteroides sp. PF5-9]
MIDLVRKKIISTILSKIPSQIKPVDYLSDSLDLGKESVYRRLRGDMAFTLHEIIKLSLELDFSIDEIVKGPKENRLYVDLHIANNPEETFFKRLQKYSEELEHRVYKTTSYTVMALNYLPVAFSTHFSELFKFVYYTWLHRTHNGISRLCYSDVVVSPELASLRERLEVNTRKITHNTFILDANVFLAPLKEVHYFYTIHLINESELASIKKAFHQMIDSVEKTVRTGCSDSGTTYDFYLSSINIDHNSSYNVWNNEIISSFSFHLLEMTVFLNAELSEAHKRWLDALKKYSTLITQSNELIQAAYFEKQRRFIEDVGSVRF